MIIESGVQIGSGIDIGDIAVTLLNAYVVIYNDLTTEDGVTQILTESGDNLII